MFSYRIDKSQGIIFSIASGSITKADVVMHIKNVLDDPNFASHFHAVVKFEENTVIQVGSPDDVDTIRKVFEGYLQRRKGAKWAIVTASETTRAFVEYALGLLGPVSLNFRIFKRENDAVKWVKQP